MKTIASLLILAAAPAFAAAQATKEDLKKLAKGGVSDDVILSFLKRKGSPGKLSSDDLVELKDAGLSERVLAELLAPAAPAKAGKSESPAPTYAWGSLSRGALSTYHRSSYSSYGYAPYYGSYAWPYYPYYSYSYYRPYYPYYRPYYSHSYYRPYYGSYYRPAYGRYYRGGYVARYR